MIVNSLRACFKKLPSKELHYRNFKNFDDSAFIKYLEREVFQGEFYKDCKDPYSKFTLLISKVLEKHAALK